MRTQPLSSPLFAMPDMADPYMGKPWYLSSRVTEIHTDACRDYDRPGEMTVFVPDAPGSPWGHLDRLVRLPVHPGQHPYIMPVQP